MRANSYQGGCVQHSPAFLGDAPKNSFTRHGNPTSPSFFTRKVKIGVGKYLKGFQGKALLIFNPIINPKKERICTNG